MKLTTIAAAIALTANAQAVTIAIDTFNDTGTNVTQTASGSTTQNVVTPEAIGGARESMVHNTSGTGDNNTNTTATAGIFAWGTGPDATGHFHLSYGSLNATTPSQLNLDATGTDAFLSSLISTDLPGSIKISFLMNEGEGAAESTWSATFGVDGAIGLGGPASPQNIETLYTSFTLESGTGAFDIADIDGILYEAAADLTSADWQFNFLELTTTIEIVPEPSSTALLGLGGLALVLRRRK